MDLMHDKTTGSFLLATTRWTNSLPERDLDLAIAKLPRGIALIATDFNVVIVVTGFSVVAEFLHSDHKLSDE